MQLLVVVSALNCDQNNTDLSQLRDKLIEIIALTEGLHQFILKSMQSLIVSMILKWI